MAGVGPEDVDVIQLHDAFAPGKVFQIEALGLVPEGGPFAKLRPWGQQRAYLAVLT
jgi:acetyl-CoA acetyltransferase